MGAPNGCSPAKPAKPPKRPLILPVDKVKRGMTGYGLSVFEANRIERFGVEIIAFPWAPMSP